MSERIQLLYLIDRLPSPLETALIPSLPVLLDPEAFTIWTAVLADGATEGPVGAADGLVHHLHVGESPGRLDLRARLAIRRLLRRVRPDIVCGKGLRARLLGLPAADALGIPARVAMVNDMGGELTPAQLRALRAANRDATGFLADSYAVARRLVRQEAIPRDRIDIIHPGIDVGAFGARSPETTAEAKHRLGLSRQEPVVLLIASARRQGGELHFMRAVAQLAPLAKTARFVIFSADQAGPHDDINREVERLHLDERVLISDRAEGIGLWLAAADVGVVTARGHGCAAGLLACMAAGLPIVAVNVDGNGEVIAHGETGYLADFADPDQLAMFIMILLLSPEQGASLGARARERARETFSREAARRYHTDYFRTLVYATRAT